MALTADEVRYIARLARVALSDEEVTRLQGELSSILEHFQVLNDIDTAGIPPTAQSFELHNVARPDETRPSYPVEEVLRNAPRTDGRYIRVRGVLD